MIKFIEKNLNQSKLYDLVRWSVPFEKLMESVNPGYKKNKKREYEFYQSCFSDLPKDSSLIFDVGANKGVKTKLFLQLAKKVVAVDPERHSFKTLSKRFKQNQNCILVNKAIGDKKGKLKLKIHDFRSGYNTLSNKWVETLENEKTNRWEKSLKFSYEYEVEVTTLNDLINEFGKPRFIKIDVEGYELEVIRGLNQQIPLLSFEANLPEFLDETLQSIAHLKSIYNNAQFNIAIDNEFKLDNWLQWKKFDEEIKNTKFRYMEIYCKMI